MFPEGTQNAKVEAWVCLNLQQKDKTHSKDLSAVSRCLKERFKPEASTTSDFLSE
jgi:hypothetical protein